MASLFGASDFDMFGGIPTLGASNIGSAALQNLSANVPAVSSNNNMVGMGAVTAGMNLPAGSSAQLGGGFMGGQQGGGGGLGFNLGTGQLILGGIQAIGNIWAAMEANKLAKEQFEFQKGVTNTNLTNQIQSYNTSLIDRINARSFTEGRDQAYTDQYISDNSLRDRR